MHGLNLRANTPALFQLFFFAFGIGAYGIHLTPYTIVLAGLSFNNAGYLAENFRGGFKAVPTVQIHAARSLGMSATQAYIRIVIPQLFRIVYYPMTNQMVWAVLMSSLGMLVGFRELSGETQFFASRTFRIFEILRCDRGHLLRDRQVDLGRLAHRCLGASFVIESRTWRKKQIRR